MRGITNKIYLSILTSILVLVTMFATTYAWVGILTYSSTDDFDINLKVEEKKNDYYLTISSTGNPNSFGDYIELIDIQKQIMDNMNIDYSVAVQDDNNSISHFFDDKVKLIPTTARLNSNGNIDKFQEIKNLEFGESYLKDTNKYYKFDLYLSVQTREGINLSTSEISANVAMLNIQESLKGKDSKYRLVNGNTILNNKNKPSNFDINKYPLLGNLPQSININSESAARFALEIYEPIDINQNYTNQTPIDTKFYQGGTEVPTYNNGIYSLGGILPEEYNLAIQEANALYKNDLIIPTDVENRKEMELLEENRKIYMREEYPNNFLGVHNGVQTKMKISVYFWFEGWDADCIFAIDRKSVSLNLCFTSDIEDDKNN